MKNEITYLEFPKSAKESFARAAAVLTTLIIGSYVTNRKLYPFSNIFLTVLLTLLNTDQLDYTILYSALVGMCVFGYHNFRIYNPKLNEPYHLTGIGSLICVAAGVVGFYTGKFLETE